MKTRQLSNQLLVTIILVCSCAQIWAGPVAKGAGGKSKNSTNTSKEMTQTTKQPKVQHKIKTTTTTTTAKPELETTTLPGDLDLDGRSAFINNQYVPDTQVPDTAPPLYDLLQQQMVQTVLSNAAGNNIQVYTNDSPQMKEALEHDRTEGQNPPGKPIFAFDLDQFDDYDEEGEEGNEYGGEGDYIPDNCEDTQESLGDNDGGGYGVTAQNLPVLQNNYGQGNLENKPYDSSNYPPQGGNNQGVIIYGNQQQQQQNKQINDNNYSTQTQTNQGQTGPSGQSYGNNNNKPQNNYGTIQTTQQYNQHNNNHIPTNRPNTKPKPSSSHNSQNNYQSSQQTTNGNHYIHAKPTEQYGQNIQKPQQNQRPQYTSGGGKSPQNTYNNQKPNTVGSHKPHTKPSSQQNNKPNYQKPTQGLNQKPYYGNTNPTNYPANTYNNSESLTSSYGSFNTITPTTNVNPSLVPNFSYGNSNTVNIGSPFSTTSGYGKYPTISGQKRHLTFRTVSSATQYVSTPLADLMFKFSIGMAKPTNGKLSNNSINNQAQVFNVLNDSEAKSETN